MSDKHPIEAGIARQFVAPTARVGHTRTDDRERLCFRRERSASTLGTMRKTPPACSAQIPKADVMRITPVEAAAILAIGIVTAQLHSAERLNPAIAIQTFIAQSSELVQARMEKRTAKSAQPVESAARD